MRDKPLALNVPWGKDLTTHSSFEVTKREKPLFGCQYTEAQAADLTRPLVKRWVERYWKKEKPRGNEALRGDKR